MHVGGYGSGGRNRKRDACEGRRRIAVSDLSRHGLLEDGTISTMSWRDGAGQPMGSISILGGRHGVTLRYRAQVGDGDWKAIEEPITLERLPRPFGGAQVYMLCPRCGRRILIVYGDRTRFACRTCASLAYASSQERPASRAQRKADKLRRRLGGEPGSGQLIRRPKHMRRTTFARLHAAIEDAEARSWDDAINIISRLQRMDDRLGQRRRTAPPFPSNTRRPAAAFW
jgi:hypothetical protein